MEGPVPAVSSRRGQRSTCGVQLRAVRGGTDVRPRRTLQAAEQVNMDTRRFQMRYRILMSWTAITLAVILSWSPVSMAQAPSRAKTLEKTAFDPEAAIVAAKKAAKAEDPASAKNGTPPRTAWGDPDLQGYWLTATYTPLQRPAALAGKA